MGCSYPTANAITIDPIVRVGDHWSMKPYSEDLRRRIVRALQEGGTSKSAVARLFDVSLSSVKRYARIASRGASLEPKRGAAGPRRWTKPRRSFSKRTYRSARRPPSLRGAAFWSG